MFSKFIANLRVKQVEDCWQRRGSITVGDFAIDHRKIKYANKKDYILRLKCFLDRNVRVNNWENFTKIQKYNSLVNHPKDAHFFSGIKVSWSAQTGFNRKHSVLTGMTGEELRIICGRRFLRACQCKNILDLNWAPRGRMGKVTRSSFLPSWVAMWRK